MNHLEYVIKDKRDYEIYDILYWLMHKYAPSFSSPERAVIDWINGYGVSDYDKERFGMNTKNDKVRHLNWVDNMIADIIDIADDVAIEREPEYTEFMKTSFIQILCRVLASMTDEIHMLRLAVEEKEKRNDISDK